ncbi:MAG: dihydroneopterin aldolase [Bacteroidetes bacterium]|nr:dihydroneopterin aldolase [Bacteroidales bacterium]NJO68298.1 dihydroneopterin aldolase [Bacteroidota bacterium]
MGLIRIEGMEFYAYHGCYEAEQIVGNRFLVDLTMETDIAKPSQSDNIKDALNYHQAYNIVKEQMMVRSNLLEHIAKRIIDALYDTFPQIKKATVKVSKLHPPMGGQIRSVSVEFTK